jgi:dihydrofolate reductase
LRARLLRKRSGGFELEIHLIPVLLGQGRRLFDERGPEHIELERTRILEGEAGVTHMHYRVQR